MSESLATAEPYISTFRNERAKRNDHSYMDGASSQHLAAAFADAVVGRSSHRQALLRKQAQSPADRPAAAAHACVGPPAGAQTFNRGDAVETPGDPQGASQSEKAGNARRDVVGAATSAVPRESAVRDDCSLEYTEFKCG